MILQTLGLMIASLVLVHGVYALWASVREHRGHVRLLQLALGDARASAKSKRKDTKRRRKETKLSWAGQRKFEVRRKVVESEDQSICSFYLVPHDERPLPAFRPGQFLTFRLKGASAGAGGNGTRKPVVRCYSLSDCSRPGQYRVSIKRIPPPRSDPDKPPGVASAFFHDHVQEGDILDVLAPSGAFYLDESHDRPVVLIGGGIGVTPVLSMLNAIVEGESKRETWFFYGVRNSTEQIATEHLENIAREHANVRVHVCYSDPLDSDGLGKDYDHAERISVDLFKRLLPSSNYEFYMCGPPPMMQCIFEDLREWGVAEEDIKFEAFGPATVKKVGAKPSGEVSTVAACTVTFSRSGKSCQWADEGTALLEVAEANGVVMDSGCRVGNCNTCITAIKEGRVTYLREPDTMPEEGSCLTCIAVPDGDLVLDA